MQRGLGHLVSLRSVPPCVIEITSLVLLGGVIQGKSEDLSFCLSVSIHTWIDNNASIKRFVAESQRPHEMSMCGQTQPVLGPGDILFT